METNLKSFKILEYIEKWSNEEKKLFNLLLLLLLYKGMVKNC